jgi:dihydrofolate reductase
MSLSIIVATDIKGGIGCNNELLFHIPEDLKRFKELTTGHTIIMGRKTFESLPKVLPNRHHIVITRNFKYKNPSNNVSIICNLNESWIKLFKELDEEYFVIGGGEIYKKFLPYCNKIYLTRNYGEYKADTYFKYDEKEFELEYCSQMLNSNNNNYRFIELTRESINE